jgi:hypothetical protein
MARLKIREVNTTFEVADELMAKALRLAASQVDAVANGENPFLRSTLDPEDVDRVSYLAAMFALMTVIDHYKIPTASINALAGRIWKGGQDALDFH